jgi:hypothetical protein
VGTFISGFRSRCNAEVEYQYEYTYVDFTFPQPLVNSGDAVRIVLDYRLVDAVCTAEDGDLYLHEQTSNQWLDPSMVQSTVYAVCMPSASTASWSPALRGPRRRRQLRNAGAAVAAGAGAGAGVDVYPSSDWDGQLLDDTLTSTYRLKHSSALRKN